MMLYWSPFLVVSALVAKLRVKVVVTLLRSLSPTKVLKPSVLAPSWDQLDMPHTSCSVGAVAALFK